MTYYTCRNCGKNALTRKSQYCPVCGAPVSPPTPRRHRTVVRLAEVPGFVEAVRYYAPRWAKILEN